MFWKQRRFVGVCRSLEEISAQVKTNMKPDTLLSVLILLFLQFVVPAIAIGTTLLPIILVPQSKQNSVPAISTSPQPKPTCQENEYGPDCTFCLAHDTCQDGHYTCDTNTGAKICLDGWKGYTCTEKDVSLESYYNLTCPDNRCRNRGECMSGTCCCRAGFTGVLCQIEIIECQSRPCQNGGTCRDLVGDYECSCRSGFTGKNCEAHLSVTTPSPVIPGVVPRCDVQRCDNGGTCYQDSKSTYCLCPLWYSGKRCETSLRKGNVSQSNKCAPDLFGTNCTTHCSPANSCDKGHYICDPRKGHKICLVGWMGARCDIRRLPQHLDVTCPANLTCKNGGQCFEGECCCKNHYSGRFCNIETIGCHSNPCLNSGTCVPGAGDDTDNYNCSCTKSFQGEFCEKHVLTTNISMHAASTSSSPTVAYTSTTRLPGTATISARGNTNTVPAASKVVSASTDKTETGLFTTSQQKTIHHTTAIFSSSGITTDNNFSTSIETSTPETTGFYSKTQQHTVTNSALGTTDTDLSSSAIATGMSTHKVPVKPLSTASVLHTAFVSTVLSPIASIHLTFSKPITESATTKETNLFSSTFETTSYRPTTYKPHSTFENAVVSSSPSESTSPISTSAFIKHTAEPFITIDNVSNTQTPFATTTEKTSSEFELTSSHYTESMKTSVYSHNTKMPSAESTVSDSNSSLPALNTTESQSMTTMEILQKYFTTHSSTHVPPQVLSETSSTGGSFSVTADTLSSTSGANTTLFSTTASTETTQNSLPSESSKTGETTVTPSGMLLSSETLPASSFGWTEKIATSSAKKQSVTPLYTRVSASESRSKLNVSRSSTTPKVYPMSHNSFSPQTSIGSAGTTYPSGSSLTTSNTSPTDLISSVAPVTQSLISTIRSVNSHPTDPSLLITVLDKDYSTRNSISSAKPGFNGLTTLSERPSTPLNATTSSPLYLVSTTSVLVSFNNNASTLNHFTRIKNGSMSSTRPTSLSPNNLPTDKTTPSLNYTHVPLTNSSNETSASGLSKNVDEDSSTWWIILVGIIAGVIFLITISTLFAVIFKFILTRESRTLKRSPEEIVRFDKEHFSTEPDFENPVYLDEPDFQDDTIKSDIYVVNR